MAASALNYETPATVDKTPFDVYVRLSAMMFLQFFVWGGWYVTTGPFMGANGLSDKIALAYTLCPIAAIISPFFLGMIADRFFPSEKVLGVLHILGALAMFAAPSFATAENSSLFIAMLFLHALCYMPTLGLTNTIAFGHIRNQEKEFPLVRVFGTIGWIVAGLVVSFMAADKTAMQYRITGVAGLALGLLSFFMPHTPPPAKGKPASLGEILGVDALRLLKQPSFLVFIICSFLICIPLAAYYAYAGAFVGKIGVEKVGAVMSIGQGAEILFMLVMPLFFARLGVKWMLAAGMLGWVIRYALFAYGAPGSVFWMIVLGIALHGICYDFFFVTGFIYTDKKAGKEIRGQAQGFLVLVTQGLGLGIGAQLMGVIDARVLGKLTGAELLQAYQKFWMYPCIFALVVLFVFIVFFKDDSSKKDEVTGA